MMAKRVYISLGSNSSDKYYQMNLAQFCLSKYLDNMTISQTYETQALNGVDAPYVNSVVSGLSSLSVEEMNSDFKNLETKFGRSEIRSDAGDIPIDIDLVIADGVVLRPADFEREYFQKGYRELCRKLKG